MVYFFLDALFGLLLFFFDCGFHFFFQGFDFLLLFFFSFFLFAFFKKCSSLLSYLWLFFIIFSAVFLCVGRVFSWRLFLLFFFHSLWRFDEFLLSLPYMALYGLSSMCYICKTSNIWVDNAQSSGLFLILKAINYFLCFCFVFSFGSVRGGRSRWTRAVHVMVDQV